MTADAQKETSLARILPLMLVATLMPAAVAGPVPAAIASCRALAEASNDLYLAMPDGRVASRFTTDGVTKISPALSPDATKAAYLVDPAAQNVTIADTGGHSASLNVADPGATAVAFVSWAAPDVLAVDRHAGRNAERFDYFRIPDTLAGARTLPRATLSPSTGAACALTGTSHHPACVTDGDVSVDETLVYRNAGVDATATPLQTLQVALGQIVTTSTSPSFGLQVISIASGVTVHVALPGGNYVESRLSPGDVLPLPTDDLSFALTAAIKDSASGLVTLSIYRGSDRGPVMDPAVSWIPNDSRIGIVVTSDGRRRVSILDKLQEANWTVVASSELPVDGPVLGVRFVSSTSVLVDTADTSWLIPYALKPQASPSRLATLSFGDPVELRRHLTLGIDGRSFPATVRTWSCLP